MMRSLYSGVTGLRSHQTKMDVIGNNIANVNTIGFKSSRVVFQDIFSQTVSPASAPTAGGGGGTNPQQIGLGVQLSTIDLSYAASSTQYTGNLLDLAIDGEGYFIIQDGAGYTYTRAGNFKTDAEHYLVDSNGNYVMGYTGTPDADGNVTTLDKIKMDPGYSEISINNNGEVVGIKVDTKETTVLGKIALATFANPNGLEKTGGNAYRSTVNSGAAVNKAPGSGGAGGISPSSLEMSNVDLTAEFTDMIVTQRGFQANSRIITTTDEMLEELVNMVR